MGTVPGRHGALPLHKCHGKSEALIFVLDLSSRLLQLETCSLFVPISLGGRCWEGSGRWLSQQLGVQSLVRPRTKHSPFSLLPTLIACLQTEGTPVPGGRRNENGHGLWVLPGSTVCPCPGPVPRGSRYWVPCCQHLYFSNVLVVCGSQPCSFLGQVQCVCLYRGIQLEVYGKETTRGVTSLPCALPSSFGPLPPLLPHGQSSWKLLRSVILTFLSSSGERGPTPPPTLWSLAPSVPQSPAFLGDGMPWGGGAGVGLDPGQSLNPMASAPSSGTICCLRRCVSCFL